MHTKKKKHTDHDGTPCIETTEREEQCVYTCTRTGDFMDDYVLRSEPGRRMEKQERRRSGRERRENVRKTKVAMMMSHASLTVDSKSACVM